MKSEVIHHCTPPETRKCERTAVGILRHPSTLEREVQERCAYRAGQVKAPLAPIQTTERKSPPHIPSLLDVNFQFAKRSGSCWCDVVGIVA